MKRYFQILLIFAFTHGNQTLAGENLDHNKLANDLIQVLNSKELKRIDAFVEKHFSSASLNRWNGEGKNRYVGYSINSALFHGELTVLSTEVDNANNRIRYINKVYSKNTDMQYELVVTFNNEQTRPITGWYMRESPQSLNAKKKLTDKQFIAQVKSYSESLAKNGTFSGTILLSKNNDVLFSAAHGFASLRYNVQNNLDTKFQIGSMNKMFTSVAILQLVETEQISLNDPLTKFIDKSLLGKGDFEKVKIKHLLTHTSGVDGLTGFDDIQNKVRSLDDIAHLYKTVETRFEPGTQWRYSNAGMTLLGQIIENVTGKSYFDYIDEHIYQKANMQHSGSFDLDVPVKNTARNYWFSVETGQITENLMFQSVRGGPAGGGYSTVGDLHKFAIAMQTGKLLNKQLSNEALTAKPEHNSPYYGYGFSVAGSKGNQIVGHNGAHLGMTARLNKGYTLVVLGNFQSSAWPIIAKVNQLIELL